MVTLFIGVIIMEEYIDVQFKEISYANSNQPSINRESINDLFKYNLLYENLSKFIISNNTYYIPAYKLYGIYNFARHFHIKDILKAFSEFPNYNKESFMDNFNNHESEFWKKLYEYDTLTILNNNGNPILTYLKNNNNSMITHKGFFTSSHSSKGSFVYGFKYSCSTFTINIFPKKTTIIIKDNNVKLIAYSKNYLYWTIKEEDNNINERHYNLLQEIIYCISDGYIYPKARYLMDYDYFKDHFKDDPIIKQCKEYLSKNLKSFTDDITYNNFNIISRSFDPYIIKMVFDNIELTTNDMLYAFLTKIINALSAKFDSIVGRKHEEHFVINILLNMIINIIDRHLNVNTLSILKNNDKFKEFIEELHAHILDRIINIDVNISNY